MPNFFGTNGRDRITPHFVSDGVSTPAGFPFPAKANDSIQSLDGNDVIASGGGRDTVDGGRGDDRFRLGGGDDVALWAPGQGSDTVDGGGGRDALVFQGSADGESFDLSAGFEGALLFRDVGFIRMDLRETEFVLLVAGAGDDDVTFADLAGSGVGTVRVDLGLGGDRDTIAFVGTPAADLFTLASVSGEVAITALGAGFSLAGFEIDLDRIIVSLGDGGDTVDGTALEDVGVVVAGGGGDDVILLGSGDDVVAYVGSGGNDSVDGGAGRDIFTFDSSLGNDGFRIRGNAEHATLSRLTDSIAIDLRGIERVEINGFGGDDRMNGTVGADIRLFLDGGAGNDTLRGGAGDDVLSGDAGNDRLRGNAGADRFLVGRDNVDGVQDFDVIVDYAEAEGDLLDVHAPLGQFVVKGTEAGLLITFVGDDQDQVLLLGVNSLTDVVFVG